MRFVYKPRATGKTFDAVSTLMQNPRAALIVATAAERERIVRVYKLEPFDADRIFLPNAATHGELRGAAFGVGGLDMVIVDNAEWVLAQFLGRPVAMMTLTRE